VIHHRWNFSTSDVRPSSFGNIAAALTIDIAMNVCHFYLRLYSQETGKAMKSALIGMALAVLLPAGVTFAGPCVDAKSAKNGASWHGQAFKASFGPSPAG
jgi:hypothetical protein